MARRSVLSVYRVPKQMTAIAASDPRVTDQDDNPQSPFKSLR